MKQIILPIEPEHPRTFDNFVTGRNALALEPLFTHGPDSPPIYLWGPTGCGKSHLLAALVRRAEAAETIVARFDATTPLPWEVVDGCGLIVLDDADQLDDGRQHAAFALFVESVTHHVPVVSAGRLPPVDLPLREDLRTRLGWGHVLALRPLSDDEVRHALKQEAAVRGIVLSDELMDYLMARFERDLKHLSALLDRLDDYGRLTQRQITIPLLRRMMAEEGA